MRRSIAVALLLAVSMLRGCASIPLATGVAIRAAGVAAGSLAVAAYHDCRQDGGCKAVPLPK